MWPRLAMTPRTPEPGSTSLPSSSSTTVRLVDRRRAGRRCATAPLATMLVPPKPVSEEPIESVMIAVGQQLEQLLLDARSRTARRCWRAGTATTGRTRCRRRACARSASSSGRAIASPVKNSRFTLCSWIVRQTSSASNSGASTVGVAGEQRHPGGRLGGAVDHRRDRVAGSSARSRRPPWPGRTRRRRARPSRSRCRRTTPGRCPRGATSRPWGSRWCRRCRAGRCRRRCARRSRARASPAPAPRRTRRRRSADSRRRCRPRPTRTVLTFGVSGSTLATRSA